MCFCHEQVPDLIHEAQIEYTQAAFQEILQQHQHNVNRVSQQGEGMPPELSKTAQSNIKLITTISEQ